MIVVGLNPSTATHEVTDPTIRKVCKFARRDGFGSVVMLNIFALRSPQPRDVLTALRRGEDAFGPDNARVSRALIQGTMPCRVVAAWGRPNWEQMRRIVSTSGAELRALRPQVAWGVTADGFPRHPLYLRDDSPLEDYHG